ncbi:hypothetical protein FRC09_020926 [Ceratobasidium sp. 395]|nr:hypothetical protein FRC09_020926 [Ceratobasidium sp. 395]
MGFNRTKEDLFGITDCIIEANNPKLQVANFSKIPIKLHAGQIRGYMFPISQLSKGNSLSKEQFQECKSKVKLIQSLDKKEPAEDDGLDMSYSEPPQGGPKRWDNPGPDPIPEDWQMAELNFNPSLTPEEQAKLESIFKKHKDTFGLDGRLGSHEARVPIRLKDETLPPMSMAPYSASLAKQEAINKQMDNWLRLKVIEPSVSLWGLPVIVVYCNGKPRVCIDYRKLNDRVVPDEYPLPKHTDILHVLQGSQYLTTLDALAGFTQLSVKEEDRPKTAFSKTFEDHCKHLDKIFSAMKESGITLSPKKCFIAYQSLILIGHQVSRLGLSTHKEKVDGIMGMAPPTDCKLLQRFLGMMTYFSAMIPFYTWIVAPLFALLKKDVTRKWEEEHQKAFDLSKQASTSSPVLAYPSYDVPYGLYADASKIGLFGILQQVQLIKIKDMQGAKAFELLKKAYNNSKNIPCLCTPVPSDAHVMTGGDSTWNQQDWLETIIPVEQVIAYWSRILKKEQRNYSATERKALALKEALIKYQPYLEGTNFVAFVDHGALTFVQQHNYIHSRPANLSLFFHSYTGMTIMHRAGRVHNNTDPMFRYLYRFPFTDNPLLDDQEPIKLKEEEDAIKHLYEEISSNFEQDVKKVVARHMTSNLEDYPTTEVYQVDTQTSSGFEGEYQMATTYNTLVSSGSEEISKFIDAYKQDAHFSKVLSALSGDYSPFKSPYPQYIIKDNGLIYFEGAEGTLRLCVPTSLVPEILEEGHDLPSKGAHAGFARTYNCIHSTYYWPKMAKDIKHYTRTCDICQKTKPRRHGEEGYLQPIPIPEKPFQVISIDFIMDLPKSQGYNAVLVVVDKLTRYAHFIPCTTSINEEESAKLIMQHTWAHYSLPRQIISDCDSR